VPRPERAVVRCDKCPAKLYRWTDENKELYVKWRMSRFGYGEVDYSEAWAFFRLEETAREIDQERNGHN